MDIKKGFGEPGKKAKDLGESYDVEHIWKQGFPLGTNTAQALREAEQTARKANEFKGRVIHSEIVMTPEHEANNEFLVTLVFGSEKADA